MSERAQCHHFCGAVVLAVVVGGGGAPLVPVGVPHQPTRPQPNPPPQPFLGRGVRAEPSNLGVRAEPSNCGCRTLQSGVRARRTLQSGGSRPTLQSGGRAEPSNLVSIWGYFLGGPPSAPEGHTAGAGSSGAPFKGIPELAL